MRTIKNDVTKMEASKEMLRLKRQARPTAAGTTFALSSITQGA